MKILRVISSMNPKAGGPCQGIRNIVPHLQLLGIENEVVCMDNSMDEYNSQDHFKIYKIGKGKTGYQYNPELLYWLKDKIQDYDVVIVHGLWQYHNYAVFKVVKQLKKQQKKVPKIIIMPHGMLDPYFQKAVDRKWKALRNNLVWNIVEKKCVNTADAVFFTCEEELLLARTTFKNYHPKKEINIGYGIQKPPKKTANQKHCFFQLVPTLENNFWLFLSRIHHKKGVDLLIDAYNQLCLENNVIPDLVIAGPIDSEYAQQMIVKAKDNNKIHFTGMLTGDAKWGAFHECDLYILPSHQENFGIAIVEAMACQKPVLITKNINIWREIEEGKAGWVLEDLSVEFIRKKLYEISKMEPLEMKQKGYWANDTFENKFSVEKRADVLAKTLKGL